MCVFVRMCVSVCVWKTVKTLNILQRSKNRVLLEEMYLIKSEQRSCVIFSWGQCEHWLSLKENSQVFFQRKSTVVFHRIMETFSQSLDGSFPLFNFCFIFGSFWEFNKATMTLLNKPCSPVFTRQLLWRYSRQHRWIDYTKHETDFRLG